MPPILTVALVGYGFVGRIFHPPLIAAVDDLRLHSVASSNAPALHAGFADEHVTPNVAEVLSDPAIDLVVIATPNALHAPQVHAVLVTGKHVVVEKPFTVTVVEAESVIAHAARAAHAGRAPESTLRQRLPDAAVGIENSIGARLG